MFPQVERLKHSWLLPVVAGGLPWGAEGCSGSRSPPLAVATAHVATVTRFVTDDFFRKMEESVLGQQ